MAPFDEERTMTVTLHSAGARHARQLVKAGKAVFDERDAWSEDQPSTDEENAFIEKHGMAAYGVWHLGVDDEKPADTKAHYKFPYGDFERVHRCGLLAAESRAGQYKHFDIEREAAHLLGMLDAR
jgi:hypothetical protein